VETGRNSEPNPPCVISALHISELSRSELVGIVKTLKNIKNYRKFKNFKNFNKIKKCEKIQKTKT
jgi:hypothetical protein